MESSAHLITPSVTPNDALTRGRKDSSSFPSMLNSQITMFKITTSAGNSIEQPVRPGDRFSGVLVVQLSRPISATQVVLDLTASERWATTLKGGTRPERTHIFAANLVLWKAVRNGAANASTVLSDGLHVFNFSCQIPNLNYPQNTQRPEFEITYLLEAKLLAPKDYGSEQVAGKVTKELFFTPLVVLAPNLEPLVVAETLYFEKKGKRGKPAVEVRAVANTRQLLPGSKIKLDVSIKEIASSSWTRIMVRLIERTRCRISTQMPFSQPLWSADRELVHTEVVRSSVYSYFINDEMLGKPTSETKTANGETVTTESLMFNIPAIPVGAMSTDHLDFTHFIRIEVIVPNWLSSDRSVYMDMPVQMMTCEINNAARFLSRRGSIPSIERKTDSDNSSVVSGKSESSGLRSAHTMERSTVMSEDAQAMVLGSLPPRYFDVAAEQRPTPTLTFVKQMNMNQVQQQQVSMQQQMMGQMQQQNQYQYQQQQSQYQQQQQSQYQQQQQYQNQQNMQAQMGQMQMMGQMPAMGQMQAMGQRQPTMHSMDGRSSSSGNSTGDDMHKEKYRSRPLPMAPGPGMPGGQEPPPLPSEPMPMGMAARPASSRTQASTGRREGHVQQMNINVQQSMRSNPLVLAPYAGAAHAGDGGVPMRGDSPVSGMRAVTAEDAYAAKVREHPSHLHTPISPPYNSGGGDEFSDDEAGYFKESGGRRGDMYHQVRKNSSLKHYR